MRKIRPRISLNDHTNIKIQGSIWKEICRGEFSIFIGEIDFLGENFRNAEKIFIKLSINSIIETIVMDVIFQNHQNHKNIAKILLLDPLNNHYTMYYIVSGFHLFIYYRFAVWKNVLSAFMGIIIQFFEYWVLIN